ncbi:hypothetical protein ACQ4PT_028705 [Festuca glaucescens]
MAQQPQASLDAPPMQQQLAYLSSLSVGFRFQPAGRYIVAYFIAPKALYGRVPADVIQDGVADGVDVYGARPEDLPFPIRNRDYDGKVWGYSFTTAASGRLGADFREVAAGGFWNRYGEEKEYANEDGDVVALRSRFAFYDEEGKLTPWRMKEYRLNEGAAAYRGIAFHPSAKDMAVWKVYNHVEIPKESPVDYHGSDDDQSDRDEADEIAVDHPVDGMGIDAAAHL